jgi:hypothetical protein
VAGQAGQDASDAQLLPAKGHEVGCRPRGEGGGRRKSGCASAEHQALGSGAAWRCAQQAQVWLQGARGPGMQHSREQRSSACGQPASQPASRPASHSSYQPTPPTPLNHPATPPSHSTQPPTQPAS